ncbi:hypothetical protein TELCIR_15991 [Teladorsagia circumcincta]|uniref:Uncharacterized protein n=1 Tax=Teladorsagia circumcincta TaxID=45464 RepID=A0A2G9TWY1_TELCI|nr:hypothetical protein TELCIR_15991 [Teladorsagia circumcincta]
MLDQPIFRVPLYRVEYSSAIDMWLDKFERTKGPLTIMKADEFREKSINQIASAIRNQVINTACQHVVIDNLQFLVNQSTMSDDQSSSLDRFHMQVCDLYVQPIFCNEIASKSSDSFPVLFLFENAPQPVEIPI